MLLFHWNGNSHDLICKFIMFIMRLIIFNLILQENFPLMMKIIKKIDFSSRNIPFFIFPDIVIVIFRVYSTAIIWHYSGLQYRILYMDFHLLLVSHSANNSSLFFFLYSFSLSPFYSISHQFCERTQWDFNFDLSLNLIPNYNRLTLSFWMVTVLWWYGFEIMLL